MKAIEVRNLVKNYEEVNAVKDISFDVEEDTFFAFLGPNGAGKSTTINIISTLLEKTDGNVKVFGKEVGVDDQKIRKEVGIVFQNSMLDKLLTVKENLQVRASFYGMSFQDLEKRLDAINNLLEIRPFYNQKYGKLSGGQQRKADIARALLNWPKLLILDEPTTGLDPKSRKDIWTLINRLRTEENVTIFLTTHYMEEVIDANYVVVIDNGEIVAHGTSEDLRVRYSNDRIKIIPNNGLEEVLKKDNITYYFSNEVININLESSFDGIQIVQKYTEYIKDFEILRGSMDDVFVNITGRELGDL